MYKIIWFILSKNEFVVVLDFGVEVSFSPEIDEEIKCLTTVEAA